jgi:hypothetical protein
MALFEIEIFLILSHQLNPEKRVLFVNYPILNFKGTDPPENSESSLENFPRELKLCILSVNSPDEK